MAKVLFLVSPFKAKFIERMAQDFRLLEYEFNIPKYETYEAYKRKPMKQRIMNRIIGGDALKAVRHTDADIIYTDNAYYATQAQLVMLASGRLIPRIVHLRGDWWVEYSSWFNNYARTFKKKLYGSQTYLYQYYGLATAKEITPICRWLERRVKRYLPWKNTEVVYQGVDPALFQPGGGHKMELKSPSIAIIQNHTILEKVKGLLSFRRVIQKSPDLNFYITTGNVESRETGHFNLVRKYLTGLPNVYYVDNVNWPDGVRDMLAACDIYVLATGLDMNPTTVLEAGLMEKPVLASEVGGVPELVMKDFTGFLIPNNDVDLWCRTLHSLASDSSTRRRMGTYGRKWVTANFSWSKIAAQTEHIILENVA